MKQVPSLQPLSKGSLTDRKLTAATRKVAIGAEAVIGPQLGDIAGVEADDVATILTANSQR
jgi:hypothetical protein